MNVDRLFERPSFGNTVGTLAKNLGARARDAGLSMLGNATAKGRLSNQLVTDKLTHNFLAFLGSQGIKDITPEVLRNYIVQQYGRDAWMATQDTFNQVVGGGTPAAPSGNPAAATPAQATPPAAPQVAAQSTPDQYEAYVTAKNTLNRLFLDAETTPEQVNTAIGELMKTGSTAQNLRADLSRYLADIKARPDVIQRFPEVANIADPSTTPQPAASPQPSPTSASAPDDLTIPHVPGTEPRAPLPPVPASLSRQTNNPPPQAVDDTSILYKPGEEPIPDVEPRQMPQVPDFLNRQSNAPRPGITPTTARTTLPSDPVGADVHTALANIGQEIRKPDPNPNLVMSAVAKVLQQSRGDSPTQRRQAIAMIRALQADSRVVAKVPQLRGIRLEQHQLVFDTAVYLIEHGINKRTTLIEAYHMLWEGLQRSQLDAIFQRLAAHMIANKQATSQPRKQARAAAQQQGHADQFSIHRGSGLSSHIDANHIMHTMITPQSLRYAQDNPQTASANIPVEDWQALQAVVQPEGTTIAQAVNKLGRRASANVISALLFAAEYNH